jgi:RNA polymerase sigma-70 factor, ECF subfamily
MEQTDEEIVDIARTVNKEAYGELIKRYERKLTRYINYLTNNKEQTEDILQETFTKGYVNLNSFKIDKKFSSWIYRIAHNETMNTINKNKKLVLDFDFGFLESEENLEKSFEKEEMAKGVRECLERLPLKYREILSLHYLEDKPYSEIGDILRMSTGTVGTRIRRGKKLLRKICQKLK